jgi:hypothetical protein
LSSLSCPPCPFCPTKSAMNPIRNSTSSVKPQDMPHLEQAAPSRHHDTNIMLDSAMLHAQDRKIQDDADYLSTSFNGLNLVPNARNDNLFEVKYDDTRPSNIIRSDPGVTTSSRNRSAVARRPTELSYGSCAIKILPKPIPMPTIALPAPVTYLRYEKPTLTSELLNLCNQYNDAFDPSTCAKRDKQRQALPGAIAKLEEQLARLKRLLDRVTHLAPADALAQKYHSCLVEADERMSKKRRIADDNE